MASVRIKSIRSITTEPVYDISVEDAHHYILGNGIVTHNSGAKYAADIIVFLSKKKDRDADKAVVGNIVKARMMKSRLTKEETAVETRILFDGGLDRYYGLLEMAIEQGCVKKVSTRYEFPDGAKVFEKAILREPEKYFTKEVLDCVEVYIKEHFLYGSTSAPITADELEAESE